MDNLNIDENILHPVIEKQLIKAIKTSRNKNNRTNDSKKPEESK